MTRLRRLRSTARFLAVLLRVNLRGALAYRAAFISTAAFMALSDLMWIVFWLLFFSRFPVVAGWELRDVATVWAMVATGYGIATGFFGNSRPLAVQAIVGGRLDYYLSQPRNVLLHFLGGSVSTAAFGDILFGFGVFAALVHPGPGGWALFLLLTLCIAVIMVSVGSIVNSLSFWLGQSERLSMDALNAMINFSTYPMDLFGVGVKVLLFTLVPAGFTGYLPVLLIRDFEPLRLVVVIVATAMIAALAVFIFNAGLRRYESGSLVVMQG